MIINLNTLCKRTLPGVFLILLAGIIVYANTFQVPFILDDNLLIEKNDVIRNLSNFFTNSSGYASSPARFFGVLTFALNYHFSGLEVMSYHVINLLIHLATALLVYALLRLTFRTPYFQDQGEGQTIQPATGDACVAPTFYGAVTFIPLFAALLFVVHPVQTQAVTYIVQRLASLATMFYLLSLVLYVQARLIKPEIRRSLPIFLLAGSVLAAVLAMKSKEIAFTLPLAILLFELLFFKGAWARRLLYLLPLLATLPIVPQSVLTSGDLTDNLLADVGDQLRASTDMSRSDYLFTQFRVIVTYLRLLLLPINQNLDYDYPISTTFFTAPVFLSFLLLVALFALAIYLCGFKFQVFGFKKPASRVTSPESRLIAFGILWFFLALSVESSLIPIVDVIFEHRLYLPNVGAATAFATGFFLVSRKIFRARANTLTVLVATIILISLATATVQRNLVWGDEVGLWKDVVRKSPQKPRPYNNLGNALNKADKPWEAISYLMEALALVPYYPEANYNLGRSYLLVDQTALAIPFFQKAIRIKPELNGAYSDLAAALNNEGRYQEAATLLEKNLGRISEIPEAHFNLGVAYLYLADEPAVRRVLATLAGLDPKLASRLASLQRSGLKSE